VGQVVIAVIFLGKPGNHYLNNSSAFV
jgi:hypothetical protein